MSYEVDNNTCTITSIDVKVLKNNALEAAYWYIRDKTKTKGSYLIKEDGKGNETEQFSYYEFFQKFI